MPRSGIAGAYGLTCVQGKGRINGEPLNRPSMIRFDEITEDEYFARPMAPRAA